jgi:hypothetical protein
MGKTWKYCTPCRNFLSFSGFKFCTSFSMFIAVKRKENQERTKNYRKLSTFVFTFIFVTLHTLFTNSFHKCTRWKIVDSPRCWYISRGSPLSGLAWYLQYIILKVLFDEILCMLFPFFSFFKSSSSLEYPIYVSLDKQIMLIYFLAKSLLDTPGLWLLYFICHRLWDKKKS